MTPAFAIRNLSTLSYAQGFTLWHYKGHAVPLATTLAPGFFSPAAEMFAEGDMILISARDGGAHLWCQSTIPLTFLPLSRTFTNVP